MLGKRRVCVAHLLALIALGTLFLSGCGFSASTAATDTTADTQSDAQQTAQDDQANNQGSQTDDDDIDQADAVGDTVDELDTEETPDRTAIKLDMMNVRVRNETDERADVTLRFMQSDMVSRLAFIRVLPGLVTTVSNVEIPDSIELSGVNELGEALESVTLVRGVDYDARTPAQYIVRKREASVDPDADAGTNGGSGGGTQIPTVPLAIEVVEPASDTETTLGSAFQVSWHDEGSSANASVFFWLEPVGSTDSSERIAISPGIDAAIDGTNDTLSVVVQDVALGNYNVIGEITDGVASVESMAPGLLSVTIDPTNTAPSLVILQPTENQEYLQSDKLAVSWEDADPDDNATIKFSLEPSGGGTGATYSMVPLFAEDPDGPNADTAKFNLNDVLPGTYDIFATIDDGNLIGTDRVVAVVTVVGDPANSPPTITLLAPTEDEKVEIGAYLSVRWDDEDEDDNARISFVLDPDVDAELLDGNEILLGSGFAEDDDGAADKATFGISEDIEVGFYRLVGVITDGISKMYARSTGVINVVAPDQPQLGPGDELAIVEPAADVFLRADDASQELTLRLEPVEIFDVADDIHIYLTNESYGGEIDVDVTPPGTFASSPEIQLPSITSAMVPNDAWPRKFDITVYARVDEQAYFARTESVVWIRREVEIHDVIPINYSCTLDEPLIPEPAGPDGLFVGLEIKWRGGGYGMPNEQIEPIAFWLSNDGSIPGDLKSTEDYREIAVVDAMDEVDEFQYTRVDWIDAFGVEHWLLEQQHIDIGNVPRIEPLIPGDYYRLSTAVESDKFGLITTVPHDQFVEVCYPLDDGSDELAADDGADRKEP